VDGQHDAHVMPFQYCDTTGGEDSGDNVTVEAQYNHMRVKGLRPSRGSPNELEIRFMPMY
jgi:hypothetical protein